MSSFTDDSESEEETSSFTEKEVKKWDQFRNVPPPVDTGIKYEEYLDNECKCYISDAQDQQSRTSGGSEERDWSRSWPTSSHSSLS